MPSSKEPLPFSAQLSFQQLGPTEWSTRHPPKQMGNPLDIAYGGYALATAAKAACLSVPAGYHIYSMLGNYLGPAYSDRALHANVRVIRQTRTFATRQVEVSQKQDDGERRVCLIAIVDFQVAEPRDVMTYSKTPSKAYPHWTDCPTQAEAYQHLANQGKVSQSMVDHHAKAFSLLRNMYDMRLCPEGIFAQNLYGVAKSLPHTQDDLPLWERSTADWFKSKERMQNETEHITNLTFIIDRAISFLPLSFSHKWFTDVAAVSSLEFALRFFQNDIDVNNWLLSEMKTNVASSGRSFSESWIWDEQGRAVASMSQQSIMRAPKQEKVKL